MEYSDDKTNRDAQQNAVDTENTASVNADAESIVMPSVEPMEKDNGLGGGNTSKKSDEDSCSVSFAGELVSVSVKSVAVVLSLIILLTCILAVAMPLPAMRIFNKFGMSERAVDFGERYIARELDGHSGNYSYENSDGQVVTREGTAAHTDSLGNYDVLSRTAALTNDDFLEALYVCINLSYNLMEEYYAKGDTARGGYYANRLEKYTRMYLSLNGVSAVNNQKSEYNIAHMPSAALRPTVYSYGHDMRVMNFRARAYLGTTDRAMFNSNSNGNAVISLSALSNTYYGRDINVDNRNALMATLDDYTDFIGQISEYLDVEFLRARVENDMSKTADIGNIKNVPVLSETYVNGKYRNYLSGDEFLLLITRENGFSNIYTQLKRFNEYAQAAVDFTPSDNNNNKSAEQLQQLYWLQNLSTAVRRLWFMEMLLYYNTSSYGVSAQAIAEEYTSWQSRTFVEYGTRDPETGKRPLRLIWEVYEIKLIEYIKQYQL